MSISDESSQQIAALRDRLTRLSGASLHITESLDLDEVLHGVLDSARLLTDASYPLVRWLRPAHSLRGCRGKSKQHYRNRSTE